MADQSPSLPEAANLEWLRKQAKRRLKDLRESRPEARLTDAQLELAREYGCSSWRALKAHVDSLSISGRAVAAALSGDTEALIALVDEQPTLLELRTRPYGQTLLHLSARAGDVEGIDALLARGLDVNARDTGDACYAMHWAAAGGYLDVVRRLSDAGGDVVGEGDDHELGVIGWATCGDGSDDPAHRAVAEFLVSRGARHHVFSAIALDLRDEVRQLVEVDRAVLTQRMSRHENHRLPVHFAVQKNRAEIVTLLLELGADPRARDGLGMTASVYAASPHVDRSVVDALARGGGLDLVGALALGDTDAATRILSDGISEDGIDAGALHLLARRGDLAAVEWLLDRDFDPNALWTLWDADVTALHLAAAQGHAEIVRTLLTAGADPTIRDSKHNGDAAGWAESGRVPPAVRWREVVEVLNEHRSAG
jgi:ankyrin repeat protein